jgi:hypothetical protein
MKKELLMLLLLLTSALAVEAQTTSGGKKPRKADDEPLPTQMATLLGGFNVAEDASLDVELSYAWFPLRYAGVAMSLGLDDNYGDKGMLGRTDEDDYEYDPDRIIRFNMIPSLAFRTPTLWLRKDHDCGLLLQCEPGMMMSFPKNDDVYFWERTSSGERPEYANYTRYKAVNHDGKWLFWRVKTSLSLRVDDCLLSVGWMLSNYNIAYCRNNMYYQGRRIYGYDKYDMTNSIFASISFCF